MDRKSAKLFENPRNIILTVLLSEYTLPESTSVGGEVGGVIPDSSQTLPPLMHMGYASRHPGKNTLFLSL